MDAREFADAAALRAWLSEHHESAGHVWVAVHGVAPGRAGLLFTEAAREAAGFGWSDTERASLEGARYAVRFAPGDGPAEPPAFGAGAHRGPGEAPVLGAEYEAELRSNEAAWEFFAEQRPAYRRAATWWVVGAAHEETRLRRLEALIASSARGERLPQITRNL